MKGSFAHLGAYLRFICRRERIMTTVWIAAIAGPAAMFASFYPGLLPGRAEIVQMAATMSNPAMVAIMGNVYGMERLSQASLMAQGCLVWFLVAAAVMNIFLVNRHTRVDEELGRLEMLRALPVGRLTDSAATVIFAFFANLLTGLLTALLLIALNIGGTTAAGALVYGLAIGAVGFLFAGLTLFAAQLFSTAQGVGAFSFAVLGLSYVLRAIGDVNGGVLSYFSPLGLGLKVEAFYSDKASPVIILLLAGCILTAAAFAVGRVRDHGAGVLPVRRGRAEASRFLRGPLGLAWRLSRGTSFAWSAGILLLGASYGSVCADINDFVEGNEMMMRVLGAGGANTLLDNYIAMIYAVISMVAAVPVILTVTRIHGEEKRGRLEQILVRSVPRARLYGSFILVALAESVVLELALTIGLYAAAGGMLSPGPLFAAAVSYLPAIWAMAGLAVLLVGLLPKLTALVWAVFGYSFVVIYFGRIMDVPEWAVRLTPFGNIPQLPVQQFAAAPLIVLTLAAVVLAALGVRSFARRDVG